MLAFIFAGVIASLTIAVAVVVGLANSMSDVPTQNGVRVWPIFAVGFGLAALIAGSHYVHLSW